MGDGEITKAYPNSRRKHVSYREHFSHEQLKYREWKALFFPGFLYFRKSKDTLVSKSSPIMTELFPHYYDELGKKHIPLKLLKYCLSEYFIATLYMDDGSLLISKRVNHLKKKIYLSPVIALYLQSFVCEELQLLSNHFKTHFDLNLHLQRRNDGYGYILRTTKISDTLSFLSSVLNVCKDCPSMFYKTNWEFRFAKEKNKLSSKFPGYEIISSSSNRFKNYSTEEIELIIKLKQNGISDQAIANQVNRSYWSIVNKLSDLRKSGNFIS